MFALPFSFLKTMVLLIFFLVSLAMAKMTSPPPPKGTPERPELRNDAIKPLEIVSASCQHLYESCNAQVRFAKSGGPWSGFTIAFTLRYENGAIRNIAKSEAGPFENGAVMNVNVQRNGQLLDRDGRRLTIVNAAVEVVSVK